METEIQNPNRQECFNQNTAEEIEQNRKEDMEQNRKEDMERNRETDFNQNRQEDSDKSRADDKRQVRRAAAVFAGTAAALLILCAVLTATVDPFFHYHAPLKGFPYVVDNQLSQNPGMAKNMTYDSIITGSSMTVNFNTNDFREAMGVNALKLSSNGAYPKDIANVLDFAYDEHSRARKASPLTHAFIAIDAAVFTADPDEVKYPQPSYLYDKNPLNDVPYLLNKDVLLQYILRPIVEREATDLATVYATTWQTEEYFGKDWVLQGFAASEERAEETPADAYREKTQANLERDILSYVRQHPETEFTFFFPPYSILYWYNVERENHLEATMAQYEQIGEALLREKNARVFYFQDMEDVVTDLANYSDYEHYSPAINSYMAACFGSGEHEVHPGGMREVLDHMRSIVDSFDFETFLAPPETE